MREVKRKICLLGAFAVGKTSLVERYVRSLFSEAYLTTLGVKVDKRVVRLSDAEVTLMIWDIAGEDNAQEVPLSYLQGASGFLLVADGTRAESLRVAEGLRHRIEAQMGPRPFLLLVNKADLAESWEVAGSAVEALAAKGWRVLKTSAKTGEGVETAFRMLAADVAAS